MATEATESLRVPGTKYLPSFYAHCSGRVGAEVWKIGIIINMDINF